MPTDRDLVDRILNGPDPERAWSLLIDRYTRYVYAIPTRMGLPVDLVDDIHQDVWLRLKEDDCAALRRWGGESLKPYLATIARRLAFDLVRDRAREEMAVEQRVRPELENLLMRQRCWQLVWKVARRLLELRGVRMLLLSYCGFTSKEIGARLGMAGNAVDQALHRARARIAAEVRNNYPGDCPQATWA